MKVARRVQAGTMRSMCALSLFLAALATACPTSSTSGADGGAAGADGGALAKWPQRPPHPTMATAAWGQRVLDERMAAQPLAAPRRVTTAEVLDALHEMAVASSGRTADLALAAYGTSTSNVERGNAVALLAAALVLDKTVEGTQERITDAQGLAAYAGTIDASDALGHSARALVAAAAGSIVQAKRLIEVAETTPHFGTEPRLLLALARRLSGDFGDATLADLRAALAARPASGRARSALAEAYLDCGLLREAADVAHTKGEGEQPWLDAIRGRALVLDGRLDEGLALLTSAQPKLDEGNRGDALYWLGRSLTQSGAARAEIEAIASTLAARPDFAKESTVLQALLAQQDGDYQSARHLVEPLVRGRPMLPVDADAAWLLVDACAGLGDLRCVDEVGARARAMDGDVARLFVARAAAVIVGKATGGDAGVLDALREAHRASPFDDKLAKKTGEAVVVGGAAAASRVRAARKALVRRAPRIIDAALAPLDRTSTCRVCRALDASAASGIDAANKALKAVAGLGPPLALVDLLVVIDTLGGASVKEAEQALALVDTDDRAEVHQAVARARADRVDPDARRRRDGGETALQGTVPSALGKHARAPAPSHGPRVAPGAEAP